MLGGDPETVSVGEAERFAQAVFRTQQELIRSALVKHVMGLYGERPQLAVVAGAGEFLARDAIEQLPDEIRPRVSWLSEHVSPAVSACAPAYAVAVLASERPS